MGTIEISIIGEMPNEELMKAIIKKEDARTLEKMKSDLDTHNKIAEILKKKIEEEENRRLRKVDHLIEQKVRKIHIKDSMIFGMDDERHKSKEKELTDSETLTYRREGNEITCMLKTKLGTFKGIARQQKEDKFNYEVGMQLAKFRAEKQRYTQLEKSLVKASYNN